MAGTAFGAADVTTVLDLVSPDLDLASAIAQEKGVSQWYSMLAGIKMDVIYNIGDAINKIGFGLVVYGWAVSGSKES